MWIESSFVLCDCAFNGDCSVDVADHNQLVITEVLSVALIGPAVEKFLPRELIKVFIRVVDDDGQLDMFRYVSAFFDFGESVLRDSSLGLEPKGVDEVRRIPFCIEVMLVP